MDITSQDMQEMQDLAEQFNIDIKPLQGELTCVFVGQFNAAKSSLLNSLFARPLLPVGVNLCTKTVVSLGHGTTSETTASVHTEIGTIENYQGQAATEALQNSTKTLPRIDYRSNNLDMPANTLFIDTPGFNDVDVTASTKAETVPADIVIFVINAALGIGVDKTDKNFILQVVMSKASIKDVFFVFTNCDCLEKPEDTVKLRQSMAMYADSERIFLLSNTNQQGVQEFKQVFYDYLKQRQTDILEQRRQRYYRELADALSYHLAIERTAFTQHKSQSGEQRKALWAAIQDARGKETRKKDELKNRSHQRYRDTLEELRDFMNKNKDELETFVENSTSAQLQKKGYIQQEIHERMETIIQPEVRSKLEKLLKSIQDEMQEGQQYSTQLLAELDVDIPPYNSPLPPFFTGEIILPLAFLGSWFILGWFSVTTLLLGFFALKAREFGLTRYADQTGLLDKAIDNLKDLAAGAYKTALKTVIAKTIYDYTNEISDYFKNELDKVTEQALKQINLVADLEKAMQVLIDDEGKIDREMRLDKAEILLNRYKVNN